MQLDPQWIIALAALGTLAILWTSTVIGGMVWLGRRFDDLKAEILTELNAKHDSNQMRYDALATLVTRHETILDPEFNGSGLMKHGRHS